MNAEFFKRNRAALGEKLSGGAVCITGYSRLQRSNDMAHYFEQESNFWYLTGIEEPDWQLIYDGSQHRSWLVMPDIDDVHKTFDGALDESDARRISGVDSVISFDESLALLHRMARSRALIYTTEHPAHSEQFNFSLNPSIGQHKRRLERTFPKVQICNRELAELRAIKQPDEIKAIRSAIRLTTGAFERVHERMAEYRHEHEIEAEFSYDFTRHNASRHGYDPIVASGKNACTLHYTANNQPIKSRQLVLIDIGARVGGYSADITRTYVRGEATKRQLAVHAAVQEAEAKIISMLKPGLPVEEYLRSVDEVMSVALASLGLSNGNDKDVIRKYMPHSVSHGLGVDVHDSLAGARVLRPGMVLTVEPGIYIPEESIGVRIEDDILITENSHQNLSSSLSTNL